MYDGKLQIRAEILLNHFLKLNSVIVLPHPSLKTVGGYALIFYFQNRLAHDRC